MFHHCQELLCKNVGQRLHDSRGPLDPHEIDVRGVTESEMRVKWLFV